MWCRCLARISWSRKARSPAAADRKVVRRRARRRRVDGSSSPTARISTRLACVASTRLVFPCTRRTRTVTCTCEGGKCRISATTESSWTAASRQASVAFMGTCSKPVLTSWRCTRRRTTTTPSMWDAVRRNWAGSQSRACSTARRASPWTRASSPWTSPTPPLTTCFRRMATRARTSTTTTTTSPLQTPTTDSSPSVRTSWASTSSTPATAASKRRSRSGRRSGTSRRSLAWKWRPGLSGFTTVVGPAETTPIRPTSRRSSHRGISSSRSRALSPPQMASLI
mmetsp:Transcript_736/g.2982  ORF Transcript_736/g.2982 Transcript_736/m.2982 type:complete len:282 (-) Transcript_736:1863-2708(-)